LGRRGQCWRDRERSWLGKKGGRHPRGKARIGLGGIGEKQSTLGLKFEEEYDRKKGRGDDRKTTNGRSKQGTHAMSIPYMRSRETKRRFPVERSNRLERGLRAASTESKKSLRSRGLERQDARTPKRESGEITKDCAKAGKKLDA